jgi:ABC-2 type transport system ATP-binding protein
VRVVAETAAGGEERLVLEAAESLAPLLGWLATLPLAEVEVEPIGLAAVYDRFHRGAVE